MQRERRRREWDWWLARLTGMVDGMVGAGIGQYGVYRIVRLGRDGSSAIPDGPAESRHATFDEAHEAAQASGGQLWVIGVYGDSEYVPVSS